MKNKLEQILNQLDILKHKSLKGESVTEAEWDALATKLYKYESIVSLSEIQTSSLHFGEIEKRLKKEIKQLLDCEQVFLYLFDEKENQLRLRLPGAKPGMAQYHFFQVDETTFPGSCAHYKATLKIDDVRSDIRFGKVDKSIKEQYELNNMLLAPVIFEGEILGVIQAINSIDTDFQEDDIHFLEAIAGQISVMLEKNRLYKKLQNQFLQIVQALADSIGKKDLYTGGHTKRVAMFAEKIGQEMGLTYKQLHDLKIAAILHDIGKIGIEDKILKKRAPLNDEEFKIMREHPRLGYEILGHIDGLEDVIDGMRFHHERPDGKGYPYGLKGCDVPVIAQIISVADTFDAMISTRPYRKGLPPMQAYNEIIKYSGTQFSAQVVEAFKNYFESSSMYKPDQSIKLKKAG